MLSSPRRSHIARTRWRKLRRSHALQRRTARPRHCEMPHSRRNGHRARTRHHDRRLSWRLARFYAYRRRRSGHRANVAARSPAAIDGGVYRAASAAANPACNAFARPIRHATHIQRPSVDVRKRPYHARHGARQALSSSSGQYRARQNPSCGICLAAFHKASYLRSRFRKARKLLFEASQLHRFARSRYAAPFCAMRQAS